MATQHSNLTEVHRLENWVYADDTARTGAGGFTSLDVGKIAYQTDTGLYWRLTATTPTWAPLPGVGKGFFAHKNGTNQTNIGTVAKLTMTTEKFDVGGYYDAANSKWTPPAGLVSISGQVRFTNGAGTAALTAGDVCAIYIHKNGATIIIQAFSAAVVMNTIGLTAFVPFVVVDQCNGTDYYELKAYLLSAVAGDKIIEGSADNTYWAGSVIGLA